MYVTLQYLQHASVHRPTVSLQSCECMGRTDPVTKACMTLPMLTNVCNAHLPKAKLARADANVEGFTTKDFVRLPKLYGVGL